MKTNKYFLILIIALLAYSCKDEMEVSVQPTPGEDVKFGAVLEENTSRTSYGDKQNNAYPIYWENGDEVLIFSPQCEEEGGVGSQIYMVEVPEDIDQNFANSLEKVGDIGVRWGNNPLGDFYSIYPASSLYTKVENDCRKLTLTMPAQQDNNFERTANGIVTYPDMRACFMYAYSYDVPNGSTVNLHYKPLTTAIRFTLVGPQDGDITINYVRIYAPANTFINGTYIFNDVTEKTGIPEPANGRNYVTMNVADVETGAYLTLGSGEKVDLTAFLLLNANLDITEDWYIEVGSASGKSYTLHLGANDGGNITLKPTKVHELKELPPLKSDVWDVSTWMKNLQRNVYLSEISIPGSWNSINSDSQTNTSISAQYDAGIRAFHIDTRWNASRSGYINPTYTVTDLGIANGGASYNTGDGRYMHHDNTTFEDILLYEVIKDDEINNIKRPRDDEYMVVVCTFAQDSKDYTDYVSTDFPNQKVDWKGRISQICSKSDKLIDANTLSPRTCVQDVLGKVIVIVNTSSQDIIENSKCLFMNLGMKLVENDFVNNPYYVTELKNSSPIPSGLKMYATHAQITYGSETTPTDRGYAPSLDLRKEKLQNILTYSDGNYNNIDDYKHDTWYYLGMGGYLYSTDWLGRVQEDHEAVAKDLNGWIDGKITEMKTGGYYPVGIVLMNNVVNYGGVAKNILMMNNMYRKAYDPTRSPVDGSYIDGSNGGTIDGVQSAAPGYSSGMTDSNTDAIGWSRCN